MRRAKTTLKLEDLVINSFITTFDQQSESQTKNIQGGAGTMVCATLDTCTNSQAQSTINCQ